MRPPALSALEALHLELDNALISNRQAIDAASILLADDPAPEDLQGLCELAGLPADSPRHAERAGEILRHAVYSEHPEFDPLSPAATRHLREKLLQLCARGARGACRPYAIRRVVQLLEVHYDYPEWLDDLWHQTDWIEPDTEWIHVPDLAAFLQRYVDTWKDASTDNEESSREDRFI